MLHLERLCLAGWLCGFAMASWADVTASKPQFDPPLGWSLGLGDLQGALRYFDAAGMREKQMERTADSVTVTWKGHPAAGVAFTVRVDWKKDAAGLWHGDFSYDGFGGTAFVEEVRFPILRVGFQPD